MNMHEIQQWFLAEIARVANRIRTRLDERKAERHADWFRFGLLSDADQRDVRESLDWQDAQLERALQWEAKTPRLTAFMGTTVSLDIHRPFTIDGTTGSDPQIEEFEWAASLADAQAFDLLSTLNENGRLAFERGEKVTAREIWGRAEDIRTAQREIRFDLWAHTHPTCVLN